MGNNKKKIVRTYFFDLKVIQLSNESIPKGCHNYRFIENTIINNPERVTWSMNFILSNQTDISFHAQFQISLGMNYTRL